MLGPDFEVLGAGYVDARRLHDTGFVKVVLDDVEIRWPTSDEVKTIAEWFGRPEIHRALGFPIPPQLKHLRLSVLPDLSGGTEPVELLVVRCGSDEEPIGFLVVYEQCGLGRPELELDLAMVSPQRDGDPLLVRRIMICVLSYLFAIRGAERVSWVRRKRDSDTEAELLRLLPRRGGPVVIPLKRFRRMLKALVAGGSSSALPTLWLNDDLGKERPPQGA